MLNDDVPVRHEIIIMSTISGSVKTTSSSVSRKSFKQHLNETQTTQKVRFQLPHTNKIKTILHDFLNDTNVSAYKDLVLLVRDSEMYDDDILGLLKESVKCISLLTLDVRLFVEAILVLKWASRKDEVVTEFQSFIVNLLSAHNYHTKFAIDNLVTAFMEFQNEPEWPNGVPTDSDCRMFVNIHCLINVILNVIPMSKDILLQSLTTNYPYLKKSAHCHEIYLHNILWILEYKPEFRSELLQLIFSRLILFDVNVSREEIEYVEYCQGNEDSDTLFDMEADAKPTSNDPNQMKLPLANVLDICMNKIFNYFLTECHDIETGQLDWEKTKNLYHEMIPIFDKLLLPTYKTHHVQFSMFYLCGFKVTLAEAFVNYLWKKVCDPNVACVHRQSAVSYLSSFMARSTIITLTIIKGIIQQMSGWILSYIATQDGLECINSDVRVHRVFYSICQALFYVIAFRHKDFVNTKKNLIFLQGLNLGKMVTSRLNPLRVCQPIVVQNFASVARNYQLAYCYSIIEHNARNVLPTVYQDEKGSVTTSNNILESIFPFDPYLLKRSKHRIAPLYLEYHGSLDEPDRSEANSDQEEIFNDCENDDFLMDTSKHYQIDFSYSCSPGFKH